VSNLTTVQGIYEAFGRGMSRRSLRCLQTMQTHSNGYGVVVGAGNASSQDVGRRQELSSGRIPLRAG
jgi:hypothetical protein